VAATVCARLPGRVDAVVSSPLTRCRALAEEVVRLVGSQGDRPGGAPGVECDDRLMELDFGAWEGRRWDDIDRAEFDQWAADYVQRRVPGGESWADVRRRVGSYVADLRHRPWNIVVVVTHAGVIRAWLSLTRGIPLEATWDIDLPYGVVWDPSQPSPRRG
jgi:alpha-ribazole phosphatase